MMFNFDPAIPREFYDPGGTYESLYVGHNHARTERFWRPPGNDRTSMITMIASMYPTVARKLARNFSTGVPYPRPLADRPTQTRRNFQPKGDPRERWCINNRGGPPLWVMLFAEERSHVRSPPNRRERRSS